jgi:low temperature requirement protein LtrA
MQRWLRPMGPRDPEEEHRAATPLELFFDLCFVAAVSLAAGGLHHELTDHHIRDGVLAYTVTFFAIWWAWMNFTWFASAYDTDDGPYRLATLVQMIGVLVLAAGVPRAFDSGDFAVITVGYLIMRLGLVSQWLRAAHNDLPRRSTTIRYARGLLAATAGWLALLAVPLEYRVVGFLIMVAFELAIPIWAEGLQRTPWHAAHIAERYGLFTLIVLGESVISTTRAFQAALDAGQDKLTLMGQAVAAVVIIFSMWWLYFDRQTHDRLTTLRRAIIWGYGHWFIFAAIAANGAGLAAAVDYNTDQSALDAVESGFAIAIPLGLYIIGLWYLQVFNYETMRGSAVFLGAAALVLVSPLLGFHIYMLAALMAALVVFDMLVQPGSALSGDEEPLEVG